MVISREEEEAPFVVWYCDHMDAEGCLRVEGEYRSCLTTDRQLWLVGSVFIFENSI